MDVFERWSVDFYDFSAPAMPTDDPELGRFGGLYARAARNGARHGTPVLLPPSGRPDPRINLFFRTGPMATAAVSTMRRYAYTLAVWLDFLQATERPWDQATLRDVEAFKDWRLMDRRNAERIRPTSFDTDRAGLNTFYTWASARYGIVNPVPTVRADVGGGEWHPHGRARRDPLRPAGSTRRQVKWLLRSALEQWGDIGLRGYDFAGVRDPRWRGFNEDRDTAFVEGLYGTGLRLREWSSVLDLEVPPAAAERVGRARLAAACVKGGGPGRDYWIPRSVLKLVDGYRDPLEGSRTEAVRRAQRKGRYERLHGVRVVTGHSPRGQMLRLESPGGGETSLSLDLLDPDQRRLLFRRTPQGLEPLWLWLSQDGLPKKPYSWEDTFDAANRRIAAAWVRAADPEGRLDEQRREQIRRECPLWATPHMYRHSFALKWFSVLSLLQERRLVGFTAEEVADLRDQLGDIWLQLSVLMGHRHPDTTRDHYLEPFTGLQVSYLMALLDEDGQAGVDALVRAFAAHGGSTLREVAAPTADNVVAS